MLCLIVVLALATLTTCQTDVKTQSLFDQEEKSNIPQDILDKSIGTKDNKLSENFDLPQQFSSSKERPELNPVLSALINEDVKKSIEAKRQIELDLQPTTFKPILTTTGRPLSSSAQLVNNGLVDQSISLDEAGSENKQTSRIQIKKGPNGVDYEYEYVYYYYDDDEKDQKKKLPNDERPSSSTTEQPSRSGGNKSRYTTVDRSGNSGVSSVPEQNEVVSRGGKQRSSIPVVEEISEERLPLNTRFPPRNAGNSNNINSNVTPVSISDETTKKISVKRPSIALVDSQSFNRDDKGSKGTRNLENEFSKTTDLKEIPKKVTIDESTDLNEIVDSTTPLMEKVAFDLYAILANENSNVDSDVTSVTTTDDELVTDATESDITTDDGLTTIDSTLPTTTTVTTEAVTTTKSTSTTTTTTTTTEAPLIGGRKSPFGAGRNRFRLRPQASSTESAEQAKEIAAVEQQSHLKPNRFSRPTFSAGNRASRTTAAPVVEEQSKEVAKPISNAASIRGRTRNRFNLRGSSTTEASDESVADTSASTTQRSTVRLRPSFQLRTRGRPTTPSAATIQNESGTAEQPSDDKPEEKVEEKAVPTRPSRFNVGRPNRLLGRSRTPALNNLKPQPASESDVGPSASGESESTKSDDETNNNDGVSTISESSTPETGLNRLRNRPRIQITASTARTKAPAVTINRKVNPLIARRKLGGSSTTQEPTSEEEVDGQGGNTQDEQYDAKEGGDDYENSKESKNGTTDVTETSSEQPRGLGLLGNRKRLQMRRPGTLVTN